MADLAKIILKFEKDILKDMPEFSTIATTKEFPIFWAENLSMYGVTHKGYDLSNGSGMTHSTERYHLFT